MALNCSLDINFESSVVILILRTVNASLKLYIKFAKKHLHSDKTYFKHACDVSFFVQYTIFKQTNFIRYSVHIM